jgi:alanine racemase
VVVVRRVERHLLTPPARSPDRDEPLGIIVDRMRTAWLEINLNSYRRNLGALAAHTGRPVLAVLKANAYGHGLSLLAPVAMEAGCAGVAVALPEEGAELRAAGFEGRIVVLGVTLPEQAPVLVENDLEPTVIRAETALALSIAAAAEGKMIGVHVKVDTGMTRAGIEPEEALGFCSEVTSHPGLRLAGVYTHFAGAEAEDMSSVEAQWGRFRPLVEALSTWARRPIVHAANSPAGIWFSPSWLDWIRGGIVTFGVPPGGRELPFEVEPVGTLKARLVQVREVPEGRKVSYAGTWTAPRPSRLALAPLGYADGVPWALGNRGCALVRGQRVPIVGRICMDQLVLDVTDLPPIEEGEEAVFLGRQGHQQITAIEWADLAGTISYEILTRLSTRLPRVPI